MLFPCNARKVKANFMHAKCGWLIEGLQNLRFTKELVNSQFITVVSVDSISASLVRRNHMLIFCGSTRTM